VNFNLTKTTGDGTGWRDGWLFVHGRTGFLTVVTSEREVANLNNMEQCENVHRTQMKTASRMPNTSTLVSEWEGSRAISV